MDDGTAFLNPHVMSAPQNLPIGRDQAGTNGHATFFGTLLCFFEGSLEANITLHYQRYADRSNMWRIQRVQLWCYNFFFPWADKRISPVLCLGHPRKASAPGIRFPLDFSSGRKSEELQTKVPD
jgi:hypothetical protein